MANIIVCADGTWNTPDDREGDIPAPTNVVKLFNCLAPIDESGVAQKSYYHPGVGTDGNWWDRLSGGSMGEGLSNNVMSAYRWLAANYASGDRIFLFGFSRGAYTVRSLGGMISRCGLLDAPKGKTEEEEAKAWAGVKEMFAAYRAEKTPVIKASAKRKFHNVRSGEATAKTTEIHFVGVWDTVGALGIPDDLGLLNLIDDPTRFRFHDTALSSIVKHARHAVAIDEIRQSFMPTMWTNLHEHEDAIQLWFPGVHSDIGGGYASSGLADGALKWMIAEAAKAGAAFKPEAVAQIAPDPQGLLHDSVNGVFKALKTRPRAVPRFDPTRDQDDTFHPSAIQRHRNPPIAQGDYRRQRPLSGDMPIQLDVFAAQRWNYTGVYLEQNRDYRFIATGQWKDGDVACGPAGTSDGKFHLGEAAQLASSLLGQVETLFKRWTKNEQADFWWTKREEDINWFCLVGVVASGYERRPENEQHEVFPIGAKARFKPKIGGYLYCFANDAWHTYANNKGSVRLSVSEA